MPLSGYFKSYLYRSVVSTAEGGGKEGNKTDSLGSGQSGGGGGGGVGGNRGTPNTLSAASSYNPAAAKPRMEIVCVFDTVQNNADRKRAFEEVKNVCQSLQHVQFQHIE